jgi:hypothetical protein
MHVFDDSNIRWNQIEGLDHLHYQICEVDQVARTVDVLFKFDAHAKIAMHWHRAPYRTLVLQGELRIFGADGALKEVRPVGSYVRGAASDAPHTEGGGDQDVIVFFSNRDIDGPVYDVVDETLTTVAIFGLAEFAALQSVQQQGVVRGVARPELVAV